MASSLRWSTNRFSTILAHRDAAGRGRPLHRNRYNALETNDSAVQVLGDETLREIARELRRLVKRILRKHGYPPDTLRGDVNPGNKSSKSNQDCTICRSCRETVIELVVLE